MKKAFIPCALIGAAILTAAAAKKANDPVLMTVNGKDVRLSEFEYLYDKNGQQQLEPTTLDQYVDMFITYKLKVADAEAAGIDTIAQFEKEIRANCLDAAKPFLRDDAVEDRLAQEAYQRMKTMRDVSHIMLPIGKNADERETNRQRLDSIRTAILGGANFEALALQYSSDPSVKRNQGRMGYVTAGMYPYPFEKAAFDTSIGSISEVVEDAPYGFHIIRVNGETDNPGQVQASHILKITRGLSEEEQQAKKYQIDSIYQVLLAGADFADVAARESEDPGSAKRGGDLGYFGKGRMVKEFDETAFALAPGQMSTPFQTDFGYHIVLVTGKKDVGSYEDEKPNIVRLMANDSRAAEPAKARLEQLRRQYEAVTVPQGVEQVKTMLASQLSSTNPGPDTDQFQAIRGKKNVVAKIGKKKITADDVSQLLKPGMRGVPAELFDMALERTLNNRVLDLALQDLKLIDADYRNLTNEYRDGTLLCEISNRKVWGRSFSDTLGLTQYFNEHRDQYAWNDGKPRFKGYLVFATSDSVAQAARQLLAAGNMAPEALLANARSRFGRNIKVEKVIAAQGENAIVDNAAFGAPKPEAPGSWKVWFPYAYRIIAQPEEPWDLRGAVSNDYQQLLEEQWVGELHQKYPYKVNQKELDKLRKRK